MSKYKISVYAITKNEEKNVDKWIDSMKEADEIVVLDTGSSDATVERLKKYPKVKVYEERFITIIRSYFGQEHSERSR